MLVRWGSRKLTLTLRSEPNGANGGTRAKMATLHAKGKRALHQDFRHAGVLVGDIW